MPLAVVILFWSGHCQPFSGLVASIPRSIGHQPYRQPYLNKVSHRWCAVKSAKAHTGGWLFKEEPNHYSFNDLQRDGETLWAGVTNNLARKNLRLVQVGDPVLYYHTGKEKAIVGEMLVVEGPQPDPASDDPKSVAVKVRVGKKWPTPLSLEMIKSDPQLASWELVRITRLSVMPVTAAQWQRLLELRHE